MEIRPLTRSDGEAIAAWRYPGRYSTYDVGEIVSGQRGFWAVADGGDLVGYCCYGPGARVPGTRKEEGTLDVGYGMRPDLVGNGHGRDFVAAILDFGVAEFAPERLRLLIASWNQRSLRVAQAHGFEHAAVVRNDEGDFRVMTRAV